jgi:hypothetical protein
MGEPNISLHIFPQENNGLKSNFIQESSRKKVVAKKACHEMISSFPILEYSSFGILRTKL